MHNNNHDLPKGRKLFRIGLLACAALLAGLAAPHLQAQTDTGAISGTATDATGGLIPGATVVATNKDNGLKLTAQTNSSGEFKILAVPRGNYSVVISATGFQPETAAVTITVSSTQDVIFQLKPAGAATTVEVTGTSPLVDTSDGTIGATIQGEQVTELPLNGRNFTNLALLTPGVTRGAYGDNASGGGSANNTETIRYNESGDAALSVNGLRPQANNYLLDGVDNNDGLVNTVLFFPPVDAIQEFKVNTSVAPAEYGRAGGAIVITSIKSGTNQFHGSAFEFLSQRELRFQSGLPLQWRAGDSGSILQTQPARVLSRRADLQEQAFHLWRLSGAARRSSRPPALPDGSHQPDAHWRLLRIAGGCQLRRSRLPDPVSALLSGRLGRHHQPRNHL
jgi:hypothetical protein